MDNRVVAVRFAVQTPLSATSRLMSLEPSPVMKSHPALPVQESVYAWLLGRRGKAESSPCSLLVLKGLQLKAILTPKQPLWGGLFCFPSISRNYPLSLSCQAGSNLRARTVSVPLTSVSPEPRTVPGALL